MQCFKSRKHIHHLWLLILETTHRRACAASFICVVKLEVET